jgi:uncharacterized protein YegL
VKEKEMTAPGLKTSIAMVLDRSGSMEGCRNATISSVNKYLLEARADSELKEADFQLMIFDTDSLDIIRTGKMSDVKDISEADFEPRGGTPLLDAIGRGIDGLDVKAADSKAVLVIVTDGEENSSRKHTYESITQLIQARQAKGWLIVFLGAGLAAARQGTAMGIRAARVANIGVDEVSLSNTMASIKSMSRSYAGKRCMLDAAEYAATASFSDEERRAMGDESAGAGIVHGIKAASFDANAKTRKTRMPPRVKPKAGDDVWQKPSDDAWSN